MKCRKDIIVEKFCELVDNEIDELTDIINVLSDEKTFITGDTEAVDIMIMKSRRGSFKTAKGMIMKASLEIDSVDNEKIMTVEEKKMFYKIVRIIMFFRKLFRKNK